MPLATLCRRTLAAGTLLVAAMASARAVAQASKPQQLQGEYPGVASFGVGTTPLGVQLAIDQQDNRRFTGTLLPYIEQENLLVKGTIADNGNCTIQAANEDGTATLKLGWLNIAGAGVLAGQVVVNHVEQGPIAFLRPFERLDVDWGDGIAGGVARSDVTGTRSVVTIEYLGVSRGRFTARLAVGGESFVVEGTSDAELQTVAVGVSDSLLIKIGGQVKINERGEPVGIDASYVIETPRAKLIDAGTLTIELP